MSKRLENDDEYRGRLLGVVDAGSIHRAAVEHGGGGLLDDVGRLFEDGARKEIEDNVVPLETRPTDADRAQAYRDALRPLLEEACVIVGQARNEGLQINWNLAPDAYGRYVVQALDVLKVL